MAPPETDRASDWSFNGSTGCIEKTVFESAAGRFSWRIMDCMSPYDFATTSGESRQQGAAGEKKILRILRMKLGELRLGSLAAFFAADDARAVLNRFACLTKRNGAPYRGVMFSGDWPDGQLYAQFTVEGEGLSEWEELAAGFMDELAPEILRMSLVDERRTTEEKHD